MPADWKRRGMRIKKLREERGWTQENADLAELLMHVPIGEILAARSRPADCSTVAWA